MIDESLNLESVGERIGETVEHMRRVLHEDVLFVLWLKRIRGLEKKYGYYYANHSELLQGVQAVRGAWGVEGFDQFARRAFSEGYAVDFVDDSRRTVGFCSLGEAVLNALERGTNYCREGSVNVDLFKGQGGVIAIVDQPGDGFVLRSPELLEHGMRALRGNGLRYLSSHLDVNVGTDKRGGRFSLLLHYGRHNFYNPASICLF